MPDSFQFLWYLNILIKIQQRSLGLKQLTSKPSFFNPSESIDLKHLGLSIWNGYRATVNTVANDLLITMDVASKIFNQKNVLDAFEEINEPNLEARKRRINDLVAGQIVMTIYNKRFYRVLNVDFEANPDSEFETKDGKMSFREYLMQQYNVRIKAPRQPMLVAAQRGFEMKIVPELCFLTGVPDRVRNNPSIMRSIREFNRSDPDERFKSIMAHMEKMTNQCKELEQGQLLKISPQPIQVRAFELPAITINLKFESLECTERGFSIKNTIKNPVPIPILRIFHNQNDYKNAEFLNISLQSRLKILGIPIDRLDFTLFDSPPTLFDELNILRHNPSPPKICIVILPRRDKLYNEVKSISLKIEIPVQCVVSSQFRNDRKIESILNNLTLQIAAKTGSQLWTIPRSPGIPQITMIVGMDVYHDTVNRKQSVLGFAASLNPDFTKYYSTIRKQAKIGEEVSASVEECFHEALLAFFEETRQRFLPNCIVVFRDGVGDSQEDIVKNVEIRGLFKVFRRFQNYEPEVVYVVICKRIDTRFLIQSHGSYFNPRAGTCIFDEEVCDDDTFYLITTNVFQGTATPVKYKIVENHSNISKRTLSQFAFSLCHLYYNWKGSIKLPVCTQLAHKLAYVVGENVHIDASEKLRKTYWYL
jgi:aubergine-like protein